MVDHSLSPQDIEAITLFDTLDNRKRLCRFKKVDTLIEFIESTGVSRDSLSQRVKKYKGRGYTQFTYTCRIPVGNPFLLSCEVYSDGSGTTGCC